MIPLVGIIASIGKAMYYTSFREMFVSLYNLIMWLWHCVNTDQNETATLTNWQQKWSFRTGIDLHVGYNISLGYMRDTNDYFT